MTNVETLKAKIEASGITIAFLARKLGISREGLYLKLNGTTEFKASEIATLSETLHLPPDQRDAIFFAQTVN